MFGTRPTGPASVPVHRLGHDQVGEWLHVEHLAVGDLAGRTSSLKAACRRALAPGGRYVSVDDGTPDFPSADLVRLAQLADDRAIEPVVDRVYPLEWIAEAHRYVEADHKRGNVVVTMV